MSAGSWRSTPLPPDWQRIRRRILARDPVCRICNAAASREVDHIGRADDHADLKLRGVCHGCHEERTKAQRAARQRKRPPEPHPGFVR